ncbi:autophagy protein Apg9-domain-containing protein [Cyathus striatus]|nr:autophagy protein Apg9-domain-containing protein [Cyathus striatus]
MSSPPFSQSHRTGSSSRPFQSSTFSSGLGSSSRPFLNIINPTGRSYKGYVQANQTVPEEDDESRSGPDDSDLEAGRRRPSSSQSSAKAHGKQKVSSWNPGASEMNVLHSNSQKVHEEESSDDEVPKSFMIEASRPPTVKSTKSRGKEPVRRSIPLHSAPGRQVPPANRANPSPVSIPPRPSEVNVSLEEQTLRYESGMGYDDPIHDYSRQSRPSMGGLDEYEQAAWTWVNVDNLDAFLQDVYYYYYGKGIYSIALDKGFKLLTVGFVTGFSTFLFGCIDYSKIRHEKANRLADVVIDRCVSKFSGLSFLLFILFIVIYVWQILAFVLDIPRLVELYKFYTHLLKIPDADIQTISWPEVVRRIELIREENPITAVSSKNARNINSTAVAKLDAHDIANRIMRQENYLIALFNKNLLDLQPPMPGLLKRFIPEDHGKGKTLSQALEWNIRFCLMRYLFDDQGRVRKVFVKSKHRGDLAKGSHNSLQRRFIFMGILNMIFAPFIVFYFVIYSFFRYFEEYRKDPSTISGRRYTPYAQWKFREFNELPHFFARRLRESYPFASMYIGQFPNEKVNLIMRFVAFIFGSFAAVFMAATLIDPDFEITPHRSVIFYLAISGTIMTVARGMIPDENRVFDPELLMSEVITFTHYMPDEWKEQLHSKKVHQEFGELFTMKVVTLLQEIVSVILTPFVLCYSLPPCAPAIIDFFREFTVHVDGRGYVCSFAEFNFERHGNVKFGAPTANPDQR